MFSLIQLPSRGALRQRFPLLFECFISTAIRLLDDAHAGRNGFCLAPPACREGWLQGHPKEGLVPFSSHRNVYAGDLTGYSSNHELW